jgi:hypothetical protein
MAHTCIETQRQTFKYTDERFPQTFPPSL